MLRRDPLVGSDERRLMTHAASPGTTSVPLRKNSGGICLSCPPSEGPACQVRLSTLDDPPQFTGVLVGAIHELPLPASDAARPSDTGHDKRAPPTHRRDVLVMSARQDRTIGRVSAGTTSVPLRKNSGGICLSGPPSEGPACQVRVFNMDDPPQFTGVLVGAIHELPLPASDVASPSDTGHDGQAKLVFADFARRARLGGTLWFTAAETGRNGGMLMPVG